MSDIETYEVLREHEGDRFYKTGETRQLSEAEAKPLVDLKTLKLAGTSLSTASFNSTAPSADETAASIAEAQHAANVELEAIQRRTDARRREIEEEVKQMEADHAEAIKEANASAERELREIADRVALARMEAEVDIANLENRQGSTNGSTGAPAAEGESEGAGNGEPQTGEEGGAKSEAAPDNKAEKPAAKRK